jgi:hypothetical protein
MVAAVDALHGILDHVIIQEFNQLIDRRGLRSE